MKVAKQLYWRHTLANVFSCKISAYFQNTFFLERLWTAASVNASVELFHYGKFVIW